MHLDLVFVSCVPYLRLRLCVPEPFVAHVHLDVHVNLDAMAIWISSHFVRIFVPVSPSVSITLRTHIFVCCPRPFLYICVVCGHDCARVCNATLDITYIECDESRDT